MSLEKKGVGVILIFSILIVLSVCIWGCATLDAFERPEVRAVRPRITDIDFQGVNMAFDVDVHNPYPIPIKASRFRYGLDIENSRFLDSETESSLDLPAAQVGTAVLPVRLSYKDLWGTFKNLSGASEANYRLHGALIYNAFGRSLELPLSHNGTFPILRPPAFSDIKIDTTALSLSGTKIGINAAMSNPNVFPLDIRDLGYKLRLGDLTIGNLTATTSDVLKAGEAGRVSLSGEISSASAIMNLIKSGGFGSAAILPSGLIQTPYGPVRLAE